MDSAGVPSPNGVWCQSALKRLLLVYDGCLALRVPNAFSVSLEWGAYL